MGLGHFGGGAAAARWLAAQGAVVTVTDLADETTLADACKASRPHQSPHFISEGIAKKIFARPILLWSTRQCDREILGWPLRGKTASG